MQSKYFDVSRVKQYYANLSPWQQKLVIVAGVILVAVVLTGAGRLYIQHTSPIGDKAQRREILQQAGQHFSNEEYQQAATGYENYASQVSGVKRFQALMRAGEAWKRNTSHQKSNGAYRRALEVKETDPTSYPFKHARIRGELSGNFEAMGNFKKALTHGRKQRDILQGIEPEGEEQKTVQQLIDSTETRLAALEQDRIEAKSDEVETHVQKAKELTAGESASEEDIRSAVNRYQKAIGILNRNPEIPRAKQRKQNHRETMNAFQAALPEQ